MIKTLFRSLIAVVLLSSFILSFNVTTATLPQDNVPLLYLADADYDHVDDYYIVLNIETGETQRFERPPDFEGIPFNSGEHYPDPEVITSPYDEMVQFVLRYENGIPELYGIGEDDELVPVLSKVRFYTPSTHFSENGRYLYLFEIIEYQYPDNVQALYRYDIQSSELSVLAEDVTDQFRWCQENLCKLVSGNPEGEDSPQTLFLLDKNSGELQEVETADEIVAHFWWEQNVLLYTAYHGDGQAIIQTYSAESDQYRILSEIEGQGIVNIFGLDYWSLTQTEDWLMVTAKSPENDEILDVYVLNNLASNPTTYPLGIQTSNTTQISQSPLSDDSRLMIMLSPLNDGSSNVYALYDAATSPTIDEFAAADFDATFLEDVRFLSSSNDTKLLSMRVSDDEWRYYGIHAPTRAISTLASFNDNPQNHQIQQTADNRWMALSIEESSKFYVGIIPTDGSQPLRTWDVGTESYVCLLGWHEAGVEPPACDGFAGP